MSAADHITPEQSLVEVRRRQLISHGLLLAGVSVLTALAWQSATGMVSIWITDSAYNHGFFILPLAGYMAWERRHRLAGVSIEPYWPGLVLIAGFSVVWLLARGAAIMEGEQIAYVGLLQGMMLTLLGRRFFRAQLLPILYLWLLVPTGGFLIPTLQVIAVWLSAHLMQLTSIPFFVEQFYFQLPVGMFFVAPGCAGLNFLLAALALSIIYADLMYVGWQRKVICILSWLGIAILANGVRIFGILWLAQVTDRQLAIVDDHLLYGWGFFLVILMGLMMAGRRFSNMPPLTAEDDTREWIPSGAAPVRSLILGAAVPVLMMTVMIGYGHRALSDGVKPGGLEISAPRESVGWKFSTELGYSPETFPNADVRGVWRYKNQDAEINLFVAFYDAQWDGHEAAADNNNILGHQEMKITGRSAPVLALNGASRRVSEETVEGARGNIRIRRWYCAQDAFIASPLEVRLRTAIDRILMRRNNVTVFTLFSPDGETVSGDMTSLMEAIRVADPGLRVIDAKGGESSAICW